MRILHVLDHSLPLQSGYSYRTAAILREQRAMGWDPLPLTGPRQHSGERLEETAAEIRFLRTPSPQGGWNLLPGLRELGEIRATSQRLEELIAQWRPHLLHAHSPLLNGWAALLAARATSLPVVYEVRAFWEDAAVDHGSCRQDGPRYRLTRALENMVMRRADGVVPICSGLRDAIVARGIDPAKVTVMPNGVDATLFQINPAADPIPEWAGHPVLGFIGSFYAYEGLELLLEAMPALLRRHPDVRLLLAGGGPQEERLRQKTHAMGLEEQVRFAGRVPHEQVGAYYQRIDLLVYPRLSMRLTELVTPLKPLEAMAMGKMVLASAVGGHKELIQEGSTGHLFPPGDAEALSDVMARLLAERNTWRHIGQAAKDWCQHARSWARLAEGYKEIYAQAMNKRMPHHA